MNTVSDEIVEVTQADRDAAAEYNRLFPELRLTEAFARHRLATLKPIMAGGDVVTVPRELTPEMVALAVKTLALTQSPLNSWQIELAWSVCLHVAAAILSSEGERDHG